MADLLTTQKATIDDDTAHALQGGSFGAVSSDPAIASVANIGGYLYVVAHSAGTVTLTATRNADGATATLDVSVAAPEVGTFVIQLGAISNQ